MEENKLDYIDIEKDEAMKLPFLKRRKSFALIFNVLFYICCIVLIIITGFSYIYILTDVEGKSMMPTVNASGLNTDMAYINRIKKGERGDIVVYKNEGTNKYVIKRLIATAGDRIFVGKIGSDTVVKLYIKIKGSDEAKVVNENYIADNNGMETRTWLNFQNLQYNHAINGLEFDEDGFLIVKDGYIFCLGDNRLASEDCSVYGPVPTYDLIGRVDIIIHEGENPTKKAAMFILKQLGFVR
ncbi:MAG: signal peptidase I [Clostridia bacterium]